MGFVDKAHMLKTAYEVNRKSRKWYHHIIFYDLDVSVINVFIIFTKAASEEKSQTLTLKHFRFKCCTGSYRFDEGTRSLAQKFSMKQVKSYFKPKIIPEIRYTEVGHMLKVVGDGRNCQCVYCSMREYSVYNIASV